ncbi:MAG: hypothetical protein JXA60_13515 [Candidatus Coatesbacteria bacterium]|nr:hypothetical protein [Candidatus Coatesbacteria bacterium]
MKKTRHHEIKEDALTTFTFKAFNYIKENTTVVAVAAAAIVVVIVLATIIVKNRTLSNEKIEKDLTDAAINYAMACTYQVKPEERLKLIAQSKEIYESIMKDKSGHPRAHEAAFALANIIYHEGKISEAETKYKEYINKYGKKDPYLKEAAELALVQCKEDAGSISEAEKGYDDFIAVSQYPFLVSDAKRGKYRIFVRQKKLKEAYNVLDDLLKNYSDIYDEKLLKSEHLLLAKKLGLPSNLPSKKDSTKNEAGKKMETSKDAAEKGVK